MSHNYDDDFQTLSLIIENIEDNKIYCKDYFANNTNSLEYSPNYPKSILHNVDYKLEYLIGFLFFNRDTAIVVTQKESIEVTFEYNLQNNPFKGKSKIIFHENISDEVIQNIKLSIKDLGDNMLDMFINEFNNLSVTDPDANEYMSENLHDHADNFSSKGNTLYSQTSWVSFFLSRLKDSYNQLLKSDKDLLKEDFLNSCGVYFYKKNKFDEAKFCFLIALELNPYSLLVINNLACTLFKLGQFEESFKNFYDILKINPTHELASDNFSIISKYYYKKNKNYS